MPKKKVHHEEHADETWLLPYSDLLTLLLALFIVMFAISSIDKGKFEQIRGQFNSAFSGGSGVMGNEAKPIITVNKSDASAITTAENNAAAEDVKMIEIEKSIKEEIENNGYSDKVKVALNDKGLEVLIEDVVLFNSGEAEVLKSVYPLLIEISKMLDNLDNHITVVGHTDNIPIHNEKYRSNWDLSAMRAINVMSFFVEQGGLKPERFSIQGYGQYSPKYDNSTAAGRAKNRRVEIFLSRKYPTNNEQINEYD